MQVQRDFIKATTSVCRRELTLLMVTCLEMPGAWSSASHVSIYTIDIRVFSEVLKYCKSGAS
jgi:hypothetical protein